MNHSHVHVSNHQHHDMHHHHHYHHGPTESNRTVTKALTHDHHAMMKMYFHAGFVETILFEQWKTGSISIFAVSWIFVFILGALYEGVKELRQCWEEERSVSREVDDVELECMNAPPSATRTKTKAKAPVKYTENALYSLMYAVQLAISYILMLVAMTFNVYLFLAIVLGVGFGHFVYAWTRP